MVLLGLTADPPKDVDSNRELDKLQGTWAPVLCEGDGKKVDEKDFRDIRFVVKGSRFSWFRQGKEKVAMTGTFEINATRMPRTIDFTFDPERGWEKWKVVSLGIYELDGNTLKLCRGKKRPVEFKTSPGGGGSLVTYKLQKP
jgi:uncharacterized protein (TIGR03067 family)